MRKPGVKKSGTIDPEKEIRIQEAIVEVEQFMGPLSGEQRQHLHAIFFRYFYQGEDSEGDKLVDTRKQLQDVEKLCSKLMDTLEAVNSNPSALEAYQQAGFRGKQEIRTLISSLKTVKRGTSCTIERELPDSGKWAYHNPGGQLVKDLAIFFELYTGESARANISHYRFPVDGDKYSGKFFELAKRMNDLLQFKDNPKNSNLGKFIYENLK